MNYFTLFCFFLQAWEEDCVAVELNSSEEDDEEIDPPTNTCFIILETCPRSLQDEMDKELITREKAYDYFRKILKGVEHLHNNGWIHRDLTRDNIFFHSFDKIKIGDFSLAMEPSKGIDLDEDGLVGKAFYRAPEISSVRVSPAADIFSLGVLLFEMLYPMKTEMERIKTLTELMNKVFPQDWDADQRITGLIKEMLDADPSLRPSLSEIFARFPSKSDEAKKAVGAIKAS